MSLARLFGVHNQKHSVYLGLEREVLRVAIRSILISAAFVEVGEEPEVALWPVDPPSSWVVCVVSHDQFAALILLREKIY